MKKKLIYLLTLFLPVALAAQNPSFVPGTFTAEDQVTLTIDVTGTGMAGATEAYIWIWSNPDVGGGADGVVNGSWTNSNDAARMTAAGTNKWSFTFTGTTLFGQSPAQLKSFGFLVKKKDGSAQTQDYKPFAFDPLVFTYTMQRVFPSKVGSDDVVTLNFDRNYGVTPNEQRMTPVSVTITMIDDVGANVGSPLTLQASQKAPSIWAASYIPSMSFTPGAGRKLAKFRYHFNGTVLDPSGSVSNVSSSESEVSFTNMQ